MRIVHVEGFHDNWMQYRSVHYMTELKRKGFDVSVLTSTLNFPHLNLTVNDQQKLNRTDSALGYRIVRVKPLIKVRDIIIFNFIPHLQSLKPDIVHIYEARQLLSFFVALYCVLFRIPYVYEHEQRTSGIKLRGRIYSFFLVNPLIFFIALNASLIRGVTPGSLEYVRKLLGVNWCNTKFSLSTLAYDPSIFYPSYSLREEGRRDLDASNTLIIGVTGKFLDYKRIDVVLNSFSRSRRSDLLLIVKGKFQSYGHFDMLRKQYSHISNIILVHDFLSTEMLNKFYNMCDFMLWTYPTNSFFEALGTRTPIIVPFGSATEHLYSSNIIHYGNKHSIDYQGNHIICDYLIEYELQQVFNSLKYQHFSHDQFDCSSSTITSDLINDYHYVNASSTNEF